MTFSSSNSISESSVVIRRIQSLYIGYGECDYIGEPCSILSHSLQAGCLARDHFLATTSSINNESEDATTAVHMRRTEKKISHMRVL